MSRMRLVDWLVLIAAVLLALALFIAGAVWRGRTTRGRTAQVPEITVSGGPNPSSQVARWALPVGVLKKSSKIVR